EGLYAPGAFGWNDLYRNWLIDRSTWRATNRLEAIYQKRVIDPEAEEAGRVYEEDRLLVDGNAVAIADEVRLARLVAGLPDEATRALVRATDPRHQLYVALALGANAAGKPILLPN